MFLVCTFLVFILIVQLKLESCNEQKKNKIKWKNPIKYTYYFSRYMLYLLLLVLYLVFWLCLNHWNSVVCHTVISWKKKSLVFSMMAAKFVFFKWILPLFVLIDIILVYYKLLGKKYIKICWCKANWNKHGLMYTFHLRVFFLALLFF